MDPKEFKKIKNYLYPTPLDNTESIVKRKNAKSSKGNKNTDTSEETENIKHKTIKFVSSLRMPKTTNDPTTAKTTQKPKTTKTSKSPKPANDPKNSKTVDPKNEAYRIARRNHNMFFIRRKKLDSSLKFK